VATARDTFVPVDGARLYVREVGSGLPVVVLHGGPDFDQEYLLPELDALAGSFRVVYYDQRGRGRSAAGVSPEDVTFRSEIQDLDDLRAHFGWESMAVLGHSWGGLVAMEYAGRHPERVSHLVLLSSAPASRAGWIDLGEHIGRHRPPEDAERMAAVADTPEYGRGELDAEADYYRAHFRMTLQRNELLELLVGRLRRNFTPQGVVTARDIEHRLYEETCRTAGFDLLSGLRGLAAPTLVLHGERDLIPVDAAIHIAEAVPGARLTVLPGCGHFAYLERPDLVFEEISSLLSRS
jgi:proline iminopeptidase